MPLLNLSSLQSSIQVPLRSDTRFTHHFPHEHHPEQLAVGEELELDTLLRNMLVTSNGG